MVSQAENAQFPSPPILKRGASEADTSKFLSEMSWWMGDLHVWQQDLQGAIERGWLINTARVISLDAEVITSGSIFTQDLVVGAGSPGITLKGTTTQILVNDGTQDNVIIGDLGAAGTGIQVLNSGGSVVFQASDVATFIDGAVIQNSTIISSKLVNVDGSIIDDNTITDGKIVSLSYSKISAVSVTNSDIVSIDFSKVTNVSITNSDIVSIAWSKVTSVAVTDAQIVSIAWSKVTSISIDGADIQDLAITNSKIGNLTIQTGKVAANAITDSTAANGTNLSWSTTDSAEKTTCSASVATGGVDVVVLWSGEFTKVGSSTPTITANYKRSGVTQKTVNYSTTSSGAQFGMAIVYTDQGTTGTHTLSITIKPSGSPGLGSYSLTNSQASFILLKT